MRILILTLALCVGLASYGLSSGTTVTPKVRIGTYDNRAIAIAYAPSEFNPIRAKMKEMEKANAAGNTKKIAELERWGEQTQRALHRQGFGTVPVSDLLAHVEDQLPDVAKATGVDGIARACDYVSEAVEVVDITRELVMLFKPSEKTLQRVQEIRDIDPMSLDEIQRHKH